MSLPADEKIFVIKINEEKKLISLFQPTGQEGKGKAIALDYTGAKLKRGLLIALKVIMDSLA